MTAQFWLPYSDCDMTRFKFIGHMHSNTFQKKKDFTQTLGP